MKASSVIVFIGNAVICAVIGAILGDSYGLIGIVLVVPICLVLGTIAGNIIAYLEDR